MQTYNTVKHLWLPSTLQGHRQWCSMDHIIRQGMDSAQQIISTELAKRRIQYSEEKDIPRWGYEEKGSFITSVAGFYPLGSWVEP